MATRFGCVLTVISLLATTIAAEPLTLNNALDKLVGNTTRGRILAGEKEVAESRYKAERIGYILPEISLNSTLPTYRSSVTYEQQFGFTDPFLAEVTQISGFGNVQLRQKIITGADLTISAGFSLWNREYPAAIDPATLAVVDIGTDKRRFGNLSIDFRQPLFNTSESRTSYIDARDDLHKAEIQWRIDLAELRKEGITAFFDYFTAEVEWNIAESNSELARFNAKWDSVKFEEGVITEEAFIESRSERLEKQLAYFDAEATYEEKINTLNHLLDFPSGSTPQLELPGYNPPPDSISGKQILALSETNAEVQLARQNMDGALRDLERRRAQGGINGTLTASYEVGQGTVERFTAIVESENKIDTKDWQIGINLNYPIFDGGAAGASVRSMELAYESARLEYLSTRKNIHNQTEILLKRLEINYAKLELLIQELDLAEQKLEDARKRFDDGLISQGTLLENQVFYFEAKKSYLTTLKDYYLDVTELEKVEA